MSQSEPILPSIAPPSVTRDALNKSNGYDDFLKRYFLSTLKEIDDKDIEEPVYFDICIETAFSRLKRRMNNTYINTLAEEALTQGRVLSNDWVEKTENLVKFIQLELKIEVFKALCQDTFEQRKWGLK